MSKEIKQYWEDRAKQAADSPTATTDDVYLRELEIRTFTNTLRSLKVAAGSKVLDVGCGDGFSTSRIADDLPDLNFTGIDYTDNMIEIARRRLEKRTIQNLDFQTGDATRLASMFPSAFADAVMTDRCLINLASPEAQYDAINQIHSILKPGGRYIAIENFQEGQHALNNLRVAMGLKEIPVRWHNLFFQEESFLRNTRAKFSDVQIVNFSSAYYYTTRVIYSKYCQMRGEEPDYKHDLHRLAIDLPPMGDYSPIKLAILTK